MLAASLRWNFLSLLGHLFRRPWQSWPTLLPDVVYEGKGIVTTRAKKSSCDAQLGHRSSMLFSM